MNIKLSNSEWGKFKRELGKFDEKLRKKIVKAAITQAATPFLKEVKARVPVDTGTLKENLIKTSTSSGKGADANVGVNASSKIIVNGQIKKPRSYIHIVENGSSKMPGTHFLKSSFEARYLEVLDKFRTVLQKKIDLYG